MYKRRIFQNVPALQLSQINLLGGVKNANFLKKRKTSQMVTVFLTEVEKMKEMRYS